MKPNDKILIIEPSVIVQKGITAIIKSFCFGLDFAYTESVNSSFKQIPDEQFKIVLVNPIIFNNSQSIFNKFSTHFNNINLIGLISTYYDRNLCSNLADCIYLNDDKKTIVNTVNRYLKSKPGNNLASDNSLSERERDVLKLLANGKSQKEIAEELFISIHTVVTHRKNISNKLGIKSTAALVIYAVANHIIDLNDSLRSIK